MFSLFAPLASFGVNLFAEPQVRGHRSAAAVLSLTFIVLIISGLVLGIVALVSTKKHGRAGIFGWAIAGTCINGLLVFVMLISIPSQIKAAERAKDRQRQRMEQRQP